MSESNDQLQQSVSFDVDIPKSSRTPDCARRLVMNEQIQQNIETIQTKLDDAQKRRDAEMVQVCLSFFFVVYPYTPH